VRYAEEATGTWLPGGLFHLEDAQQRWAFGGWLKNLVLHVIAF
jgi:hypothetical protein